MNHNQLSLPELLELIPACVDTKIDEPFNNFCLHIEKRNYEAIRYVVKYICDSYTAEEIVNPHCARVLHSTSSATLEESLIKMLDYLKEQCLINER